MALETVRLEHVPDSHRVHVALFKDVSNADFLLAQLLARNPDFEYAFIDAASVFSRLQVLAATYKALSLLLARSLKTPNVHSEIVLSMSPAHNIAEAYRRWGIAPSTTKHVVVVKVVFPSDSAPHARLPTPDDIWAHLREHVKGTPVVLCDDEIATCTDWPRLKKYYKLNGAGALSDISDPAEQAKEMAVIALGAMALRGL